MQRGGTFPTDSKIIATSEGWLPDSLTVFDVHSVLRALTKYSREGG